MKLAEIKRAALSKEVREEETIERIKEIRATVTLVIDGLAKDETGNADEIETLFVVRRELQDIYEELKELTRGEARNVS